MESKSKSVVTNFLADPEDDFNEENLNTSFFDDIPEVSEQLEEIRRTKKSAMLEEETNDKKSRKLERKNSEPDLKEAEVNEFVKSSDRNSRFGVLRASNNRLQVLNSLDTSSLPPVKKPQEKCAEVSKSAPNPDVPSVTAPVLVRQRKDSIYFNKSLDHPLESMVEETIQKSVRKASNAKQVERARDSYNSVSMSEEELKRKRLRAKVIEEIIKTEEDYIEDVAVLVKVYYLPLVQSKILDKKTIETVFGNIPLIIRVNYDFLASLQRLRDYPSDQQTFGSLFEEFVCISPQFSFDFNL